MGRGDHLVEPNKMLRRLALRTPVLAGRRPERPFETPQVKGRSGLLSLKSRPLICS